MRSSRTFKCSSLTHRLGRSVALAVSLLGTLLAFSSQAVAEENWLRSIPEFELSDQAGKTHTLADYADRDLIVFYVQGVGCPIARIAVPSYREVRAEFESRNVAFMMFNSNIQDNIPRIAREVDEFGIDFTVLKDEGQSLAKALGVERTAEVFVIDPKSREVFYRGPINDKLGYETQKNTASAHYLKDALNTVLAGGKVNMDDVPDSKGCLVAIF
jgi:peroxiredoxin